MRCGAKCFLVEVAGKVKVKSVNARTPAGARDILSPLKWQASKVKVR